MTIRFGGRKWSGPGPITTACVLLAVVVVLDNVQSLKGSLSALSRNSFNVFNAQNSSERDVGEQSHAALMDAIVSIVQTYYVDTDRVDNQRLIGGAMRSLAYAIPDLTYEESETDMTLTVKGEAVTFARSTHMSYDDLMAQFKVLTTFCAKRSVADLMTTSSMGMLGSERNASTMVLNAMLSSLDAHSALMSAEGYKELRQGTEGSFGGLGVLVGVKDHQLTVLKPMPRSPAQRAGIKKNDRILSIDGFSTFGFTLDQLVGHMRGEPGTAALLTILRQNAHAPLVISVPREVIEVDSVEVHPYHQGNLHYLRLVIDSFASRTGREVAEAIRNFRKQFPLHGVILDMRSNPGGLLDQAIAVSDIFLRSGVIVSTKGRRDEVERAASGMDEVDFPLVVLMNEDSASASEIVAGALQDNARAIVVGQPSFGKGSVQTLFELPEDRALKLTIARYLTPSNKSIQNVGIMPDVWTQPVYRRDVNKNLFGPYRYRNEAFLPNHLSAVAESKSEMKMTPRLKGYYLRNAEVEDSEEDIEMKVAHAVIAKSYQVYGQSLPEGARRASHLLAVAMPDIKSVLSRHSADAAVWMSSKYNVGWDMNRSATKSPLALQINEQAATGVAGSRVQVPWRVSNISSHAAQNVSVFVQSPIAGIETQEVLVGSISPGETKAGAVEVLLPDAIAEGKHRVLAGVAADALPIEGANGEFVIAIKSGEYAEIKLTNQFVDGDGSRNVGVLDEGEQATVKIKLQNQGPVVANNVRVQLSNLSGKQIALNQTTWTVGSIEPQQFYEISVPIKSIGRLSVAPASLGVVVESAGSKGVVTSLVEIKTSGSVNTAAQTKDLLSH